MADYFLKISKIKKAFGNKKIYDGISYEFSRGVYYLRGPNGSGKSTLIDIMAGFSSCDEGSVEVEGFLMPSVEAKNRVAYVPDSLTFYPLATGEDFLEFVSYIRGLKVAVTKKWVENFGLESFMQVSLQGMSSGTQKKFFLTAALSCDPSLIFADEPTNALDRESKMLFIEYLLEHKDKKTIIISTHDEQLIQNVPGKELWIDREHPISSFK